MGIGVIVSVGVGLVLDVAEGVGVRDVANTGRRSKRLTSTPTTKLNNLRLVLFEQIEMRMPNKMSRLAPIMSNLTD